MLLNYNIDLIKEYYVCPYNPSASAGDLPLLVEGMARCRYGPQYFTEREGMDTYLLLYTHEGEGVIDGPDGMYTTMPGTVAILDGKTYHRYQTGQTGYWDMSWIHFRGICAGAYHRHMVAGGEHAISMTSSSIFLEELDRIRQLMDGNLEIRDVQITRELTQLLVGTMEEGRREEEHPPSEAVRQALDLLQANFRQPVELRWLASRVHQSLWYFLRSFKEQTGQTPHQYLLRLRITDAQKRLLSTGKMVEEIALESGFADSTSFIRCFKKMVGMTPLQYRKRYVV